MKQSEEAKAMAILVHEKETLKDRLSRVARHLKGIEMMGEKLCTCTLKNEISDLLKAIEGDK